jgi:hypothetical protein
VDGGDPATIRNRGARCHCQGHRLAIVIGPPNDHAIKGALKFVHALSDRHVQHKLFFSVQSKDSQPYFDHPKLIQNEDGSPAFHATTNDPVQEFLHLRCQDCCHWDEVILFCHGGQKNIWYVLLKNLPRLLGDRPVRKFVLWMCETAGDFFPDHKVNVEGIEPTAAAPAKKYPKLGYIHVFEQIAHILRPKSCSVPARCDCKHANCICQNADDQRHPRHCPDGQESVKLLCAAWYKVSILSSGMSTGAASVLAAKVGLLEPNDAPNTLDKWVLSSPDGKLREVTIAPGGAVTTADPGTSDNVFAGTPLVENQGLQESPSSTKGNLAPDTRTKPTSIEQPSVGAEPAYDGPKVCPAAAHEGCLSNP